MGGYVMEIKIFSALRGIESIRVEKFICVVIDVLRASSTVLCLMENGASKIKVTNSVKNAINLKKYGYYLIGEQGDNKISHFDFDNSPYLVSRFKWNGKKIVIMTSNGTRALIAVQSAFKVLLVGFRNIVAAAKYIKKYDFPLAIIPIGNNGESRLEDELCAYSLRDLILDKEVDWNDINIQIIRNIENKIAKKKAYYRNDVELSLAYNQNNIIPALCSHLFLKKLELK